MAPAVAPRAASRTKVPRTPLPSGPTIPALDYSFTLALKAANRSERTVGTYRESVGVFAAWLEREGLPLNIDAVTREQVERWVVWMQEQGYAPATVATRFRGVHRFFAWCVEEDEIAVSPVARMREPKGPEKPRHVISTADLQALLAVCEGRDFRQRRDMAILRIFIDTGMRRGEMAAIQLADVDWQQARILVRGKGYLGETSRYVKLGKKALRALDSYRRVRDAHPYADLPDLWLSRQGALSQHHLARRIGQWAEMAGLPRHVHAHLFRHTFAHQWLEGGGQEQDLMQLGGWRSPSVMYRYGQSLRAARALSAHERLSPGDRL